MKQFDYIEDLIKNGKLKDMQVDTTWSITPPPCKSKFSHYIDLIYKLSDRLNNGGILYADSLLVPILTFCDIFTLSSIDEITGTYLSGYLKDIPVYISPYVDRGDVYYIDEDKNITKYKFAN